MRKTTSQIAIEELDLELDQLSDSLIQELDPEEMESIFEQNGAPSHLSPVPSSAFYQSV